MALPKLSASQFHTAKFKVHNPSGYKRRRLIAAIDLISKEYTLLLDILSKDPDAVEQGATHEYVNKNNGVVKQFYSKINLSSYIRSVLNEHSDRFNCRGSLKDIIVEEATGSILSYLQLKTGDKQDDTSFPSGKEDIREEKIDELLDEVLEVDDLEKEKELKASLKRRERHYQRPISFVRFRDAALVRTKDGTKIYAIVNIGADAKKTVFRNDLLQVTDNKPYKDKPSTTKITLPLEMGRWSMYKFFRKGTPKTSKLYYEEETDTFYLNYTFSFETPTVEPQSFMGIDRGKVIVGAYGVVDFDNNVLIQGTATGQKLKDKLNDLDEEIRTLQAKSVERIPFNKWRRVVNAEMHNIANEIVRVAKQYNSVIAFENLQNITRTHKRVKGAPRNPFNKALRKSQYRNLKQLVEYKANFEGLPVVEVNPAYTSQTCHVCGKVDSSFRLDQASFKCDCGNEMNADINASLVIASKANWIYNYDGLKGKYKNTGHFISELRNTRISA